MFKKNKIREVESNNLPLSPPALVSAQITEAFSAGRSTQSVEPRPETSVCTGQRLQSTNKMHYQVEKVKQYTQLCNTILLKVYMI